MLAPVAVLTGVFPHTNTPAVEYITTCWGFKIREKASSWIPSSKDGNLMLWQVVLADVEQTLAAEQERYHLKRN